MSRARESFDIVDFHGSPGAYTATIQFHDGKRIDLLDGRTGRPVELTSEILARWQNGEDPDSVRKGIALGCVPIAA